MEGYVWVATYYSNTGVLHATEFKKKRVALGWVGERQLVSLVQVYKKGSGDED